MAETFVDPDFADPGFVEDQEGAIAQDLTFVLGLTRHSDITLQTGVPLRLSLARSLALSLGADQ